MKALILALVLTLNNAAPYAQTETWVLVSNGVVIEEDVYWVNPQTGTLYLMYENV